MAGVRRWAPLSRFGREFSYAVHDGSTVAEKLGSFCCPEGQGLGLAALPRTTQAFGKSSGLKGRKTPGAGGTEFAGASAARPGAKALCERRVFQKIPRAAEASMQLIRWRNLREIHSITKTVGEQWANKV
jgi:hypothetical protein